jgi:hypothetical protein
MVIISHVYITFRSGGGGRNRKFYQSDAVNYESFPKTVPLSVPIGTGKMIFFLMPQSGWKRAEFLFKRKKIKLSLHNEQFPGA